MRKKLGELLVEQGLVDREQLQQALSLQRRNGMRLGLRTSTARLARRTARGWPVTRPAIPSRWAGTTPKVA